MKHQSRSLRREWWRGRFSLNRRRSVTTVHGKESGANRPSDAVPFVIAIVAAVGGLALASHSPVTYKIELAIFVLATCYGYWSEKRYFDRRERRHVGGTMPNQAVALRMSRTELLQVYGEAGQYDRHYSTVRATVCVFLLTAAVALSAYIMQTPSRPAGQGTSGPVAAAPRRTGYLGSSWGWSCCC